MARLRNHESYTLTSADLGRLIAPGEEFDCPDHLAGLEASDDVAADGSKVTDIGVGLLATGHFDLVVLDETAPTFSSGLENSISPADSAALAAATPEPVNPGQPVPAVVDTQAAGVTTAVTTDGSTTPVPPAAAPVAPEQPASPAPVTEPAASPTPAPETATPDPATTPAPETATPDPAATPAPETATPDPAATPAPETATWTDSSEDLPAVETPPATGTDLGAATVPVPTSGQ